MLVMLVLVSVAVLTARAETASASIAYVYDGQANGAREYAVTDGYGAIPVVPDIGRNAGSVCGPSRCSYATNTADDLVVIGKEADLAAPGAIRPGETTLLDRLPDQHSPKLNWQQNSSVLRTEMSRGLAIRDASVDPVTGDLINNTGFLRAERNRLTNHGWTYDPKTTMWNPPG